MGIYDLLDRERASASVPRVKQPIEAFEGGVPRERRAKLPERHPNRCGPGYGASRIRISGAPRRWTSMGRPGRVDLVPRSYPVLLPETVAENAPRSSSPSSQSQDPPD